MGQKNRHQGNPDNHMDILYNHGLHCIENLKDR